MSALAAIYNLDGRPVAPATLIAMRDSAAARGPDAATAWIRASPGASTGSRGNVGLAHRMLRTTPESLAEQQPWADESGDIVLIYAGRVDNGEELRRHFAARRLEQGDLQPGDLQPRNSTDAELLLRAYQLWGEDFPAHVLGDFAIVLWDERRQTLFCARDVAGIGQLHYFTDGRVFICASEIRQLLEHFAAPPPPNEAMIAGCLAAQVGNFEETIYQGIFRVAPGCSLSVSRSGVIGRRYWEFNPAYSISYKTDDDYAQRFLELFRNAVRCRTRSSTPIGLLLSGGLDSSSVGGMLHSLQRDGELLAPSVELYSLVFPGMDCDESPYIKLCANRWHTASHTFEPDGGTLLSIAEEIARTKVLPEGPSPRGLRSIRRAAQARGVRVMLNGWGADEMLAGSQFHHADMLAGLRLPSLIAQVRAERAMGLMDAKAFLRNGIGPLVPLSWRRARRRLMERLRGESAVPRWIAADFAARVGVAERATTAPPLAFPTYAQRRIYQEFRDYYGILDLETYEPAWAEWQVQVRSPFLDRPLMEFCMALPEEQRWRGPWTKYVMRQAMRPFVPAEILGRTDKAAGGRSILPFLAEAGEGFFASLQLAKLGWVCTDETLRIYRATAAGWGWKVEPRPDYSWPIWFILGSELWYRSIY